MNEMMAKYRVVLTKGVGKDVLADILHMCHFGATLDMTNPHQIAEYNVGIVILKKCGILGVGTMEEVINQLCAVSPKEVETEKEEEE